MIPKGLFTQIGMVIISIAIVITYIKPTFAEIGGIQDDISVYQEKRENISAVNSRLASLTRILDEDVSNSDRRGLLTYMPDEVDSISVTRDLFLITKESGAFYVSAQYDGQAKPQKSSGSDEDINKPVAHSFSLSVEGTYTQLKTLLILIEQNHYPLELHSLNVSQLDGGFLTVEIGLVTYAYQNALTDIN